MILFRCFWCYQPHTECASENDPIAGGWMRDADLLTPRPRRRA